MLKSMFIWPLEKYSKNVSILNFGFRNTLLCISKCKNERFHRLISSTINIFKKASVPFPVTLVFFSVSKDSS